MIRIAVLASGTGTNFAALLAACSSGQIDGRINVVLSNVPGAGVLDRARAAGVATELVPSLGTQEREAHDEAMLERLRRHEPHLVCLAGYMRLLSPVFLRAFGPGEHTGGCPRIMNIHPALLPSFPGLHAQRQALAHGVRFAGCTVHFVDQGTDSGPIVAQAVVPVLDADTEETLAARILREEHRLYPRAVQWFAQGRLSLEGRRVVVRGARSPDPVALSLPSDD
ncbi:MAG TPA: phosphoribosylglycinamide formyltransferase [Anaeromyxobacteraceae bacterium]|nr:phosphoribosylglycinamide formyltransferase [Anaeromyxobacteraceae bacterium]